MSSNVRTQDREVGRSPLGTGRDTPASVVGPGKRTMTQGLVGPRAAAPATAASGTAGPTDPQLAPQLAELQRSGTVVDRQIGFDLDYHHNLDELRNGRLLDRGVGWSIETTARAKESVSSAWTAVTSSTPAPQQPKYADRSVALPPAAAWEPARAAIHQGLDALAAARAKQSAGDAAGARRDFDVARAAIDRGRLAYETAHRRLIEYRERTDSGGRAAITILQGIEAACVAIEVIASGAWTAGVLEAGVAAGTGTTVLGATVGGATSAGGMATTAGAAAGTAAVATAAVNTAEQASSGDWDPQKILRESGHAAATTFATTLVGGALATMFSRALGAAATSVATTMGPEAVAAVRQAGTAQLINFLGGATGGGLVSAIQQVISVHLAGGKPLSAGEFTRLVVEEIIKGGLMQVAIGAALSKVKMGVPGGEPPKGEPPKGGTYGSGAEPHANEVLAPVPDEILAGQVRALAAQSKATDRGGLAILDGADGHLAVAANPAQRVPGWFDVVVHGTDVGETAGGFRVIVRDSAGKVVNRYVLTPHKLAAVIRDSNWRSGMPIRLFACRAGRVLEGGVAAAAELATILKTEVVASNQVNIDLPRGFAAYPLERDVPTEYSVFKPEHSTLELKPGFDAEKIAGGKPPSR